MLKILKSITIGYTFLLVYLSIGNIHVPDQIQIEFGDKIGHVIAYFGLMILWFSFLYAINGKAFKVSIGFAAIGSILFGLLMEFLQVVLTDYRTADWYDVIANSLGVVIAILCLFINTKKIAAIKNRFFEP